jgi:hypothetical protein
MRKAINENRTVQLALLGVLALVGGLMLLKAKGGGDSASEPAATSTTPAAPAPAPTGTPAPAPTGTPVAASGAVPVSNTAVPTNLIPGPGLPQSLLHAYREGDAIALLVRRAGGIDDSLVRGSVEGLHALPDVAVYVTKAKGIARYAWLTQGVNVTDLPALVVLKPRKVSGGTPTASVSYGFRNAGSVVQAVKDAVYSGPTDRPYHP